MRCFLVSKLSHFSRHFLSNSSSVFHHNCFRIPIKVSKTIRLFSEDKMFDKSTQCYTEQDIELDNAIAMKKVPPFPEVFDGDNQVSC